jgi:Guanylate kinase
MAHSNSNKVIIFSAPSGAGKSTIVNHLLKKFPFLEFSISATSRSPRGEEVNGVHYYFMKQEEFESHIQNNDFVEYEEVYKGSYYGTLKSEVERIWTKGHIIVFDIDVQGGINLKRLYDKMHFQFSFSRHQ